MSEQRWTLWQDDGGRWHDVTKGTPPDKVAAAIEVVPASWDGLMAILDTYYPAEVFTGESGDVGARIVVLTRELARLRAVEEAAREVDEAFSKDYPSVSSEVGSACVRLRSALLRPDPEGQRR